MANAFSISQHRSCFSCFCPFQNYFFSSKLRVWVCVCVQDNEICIHYIFCHHLPSIRSYIIINIILWPTYSVYYRINVKITLHLYNTRTFVHFTCIFNINVCILYVYLYRQKNVSWGWNALRKPRWNILYIRHKSKEIVY